MPPNCIKDSAQECIGYAEAQILKHQIEELVKKQEADRENNRKDHKEFYERLEFGERRRPSHRTSLPKSSMIPAKSKQT